MDDRERRAMAYSEFRKVLDDTRHRIGLDPVTDGDPNARFALKNDEREMLTECLRTLAILAERTKTLRAGFFCQVVGVNSDMDDILNAIDRASFRISRWAFEQHLPVGPLEKLPTEH